MLVHRKKRPRYTVDAPLTALIDIVFLLLIYFLLTTNFMVDEGIKIKLPQAKASAPQTEETITVYVDRQGRSFIENEEGFHRPSSLIGSKRESAPSRTSWLLFGRTEERF